MGQLRLWTSFGEDFCGGVAKMPVVDIVFWLGKRSPAPLSLVDLEFLISNS
jgi:hypothetical protein